MGAGMVTFPGGRASYPWQNATQGQVGFGAAVSADEKANLAVANTDYPLGVLINAPKLGEFISVCAYGDIVEAVCGAAITTTFPNLVTVTVDATGRFIIAAKTATTSATKEWAWGVALKSTTAVGQKFMLRFMPFEMDIA